MPMIDDEESHLAGGVAGNSIHNATKTFTMNDIRSNNAKVARNGDDTEIEDVNKILRVPNIGAVKRPGQMAPLPVGMLGRNDNALGNFFAANTEKKEVGAPMKYSDYIKQEKLRKFKRLPRLIDQRGPVKFTCPSCNKDGETSTSYEVTGG